MNLTINGVDVGPLIEAELDRRYPDRAKMRPAGAGGEWSFIETLRHLVFATDAWIRRALLGDLALWHPLDLPWDEMPDTPGVPRDRDARPALEAVLELRRDRMPTVRQVIEGLAATSLGGHTEPVDGPGWPEPRSYPVNAP